MTYPLVEDLGVVRQNPVISGRDGTFSASIDGKSYWAFNDTAMTSTNAEGKNFISNTLAWTTSLDASKGIYLDHDYVDSLGRPTEYVPFTEDEQEFNSVHAKSNCTAVPASTCGEEYALWPGPVVPVPGTDTIYQFYGIVLRGGDLASFQPVGTGIAIWSKSTGVVTRPEESPESPHPTLMWQGNETTYADGALLDGQYLYAFGCATAFLVKNCSVARAPVDSATLKSAWTYYTADGTWSADASAAVTVFQGGAAGNSVFYSPALGKYLAIYSQPLANDVYYRTASNIWGPWSDQIKLFTATASSTGDPDYAALAHPEFAEQNGNVQYITYVRDTGFLAQEIRLVRVTFRAPGQ